MAHFARIVGGVVQQVIVAEQEYIDAMTATEPGEWIQCSYNSRGGLHFGENGDPSGKNHLRYNYPSVGWLYEKDADAFYTPSPGDGWELDTTTYTWVKI